MTRLWRDWRLLLVCLNEKGPLGALFVVVVGSGCGQSVVIDQIGDDSEVFELAPDFGILKGLVLEDVTFNDQAVLFTNIVELEFSLNVVKVADDDLVF